jgi:DNA-directed RNA polymerase subunit delta
MVQPPFSSKVQQQPQQQQPSATPSRNVNYLSFVNGDWATIERDNPSSTTNIKSPDGKTIRRPKIMLRPGSYHNNDDNNNNSSHHGSTTNDGINKVVANQSLPNDPNNNDYTSSDDDNEEDMSSSRNTKNNNGFLSDDDGAIEIDDDDFDSSSSSSDDANDSKKLNHHKSFVSTDGAEWKDVDDAPKRSVGRTKSGQVQPWDGFRIVEVTALMKLAMPGNSHPVSDLLKQFAGREAELIQTLQTMCRRNKTKKHQPIHHSRGAISKEGVDSRRRTGTIVGRRIDAIARIAAASTLDDQTKAVKPEFVVDGTNREDTYDDQSFWGSKTSLSFSSHSNEENDNDPYNDDDDDNDPSQLYDDDDGEDEESYDNNEDSYYDDDEEEQDENDGITYNVDDDEEDASEGSSASWDNNVRNNVSSLRRR